MNLKATLVYIKKKKKVLFYMCISAYFCGYSHVLVLENAPHEISSQN